MWSIQYILKVPSSRQSFLIFESDLDYVHELKVTQIKNVKNIFSLKIISLVLFCKSIYCISILKRFITFAYELYSCSHRQSTFDFSYFHTSFIKNPQAEISMMQHLNILTPESFLLNSSGSGPAYNLCIF